MAGARRRFDDKVVVVTGGGAGIGLTFARRFAAEGAAVVIADLDPTVAGQAVEGIEAAGGRALAAVMDVTDDEAATRMAEAAVAAFGGVDVLVNNAGMHVHHARAPFTLEALGQWRRILDVNVLGPLTCTLACRAALAARGGVVLNQSSAAAYRAGGAYGVSKLALNSLTAALARELAPEGTRVVGMAPGMVDSPAALESLGDPGIARNVEEQLVKRVGRMEDLADLALFLCSAEASFVTGTTVVVDGGLTRRPV